MADTRMRTRFLLSCAAVVGTTVSTAGCGSGEITDDTSPDGVVAVEVGEWYVRPETSTALDGPVEFDVVNEGTMPHEFVVVRTDVAPGKIPVSGGVFDEDDESIEVVAEIVEWKSGESRQLVVDLDAGKYQLVCNLPGHYALGMWAGFTVS